MPTENEAGTAVQRLDPYVGSIFDQRFRVEERLAEGGFGAIYRARHVKSGHEVALKVLLPEIAQDIGVVARFRREGATLTALRNPHTIAAYELGQAADRTLFIVMELLHGSSLFDRYRAEGPFEWKRMVKISREVCESLAEAHGMGIVHRDLKPTNIHLEVYGEDRDYVKVLDFGIAKILRGSTEFEAQDITNAGQMIGTLDYMSPEQMVGGAVTGQTDIYTLGLVMYEMIAGVTAFPIAQTASAALAAMLKTKPDPLFLRAPVPEELDRIVMRCLERETSKRFQNVQEIIQAFSRLVGSSFSTDVRTQPGDDTLTAVTPPPVWGDADDHAPTVHRRTVDAPTVHARHGEEAPTTYRRPPDASKPPARSPAPQPAAAPFSDKKRPSAVPSAPVAAPPSVAPPQLPHAAPAQLPHAAPGQFPPAAPAQHPPGVMASPVPSLLASPPSAIPATPRPGAIPGTPQPYLPSPYVSPVVPFTAPPPHRPPTGGGRRSFDMGDLAAREAAVRRFVWIAALIVTTIVGAIVWSLL